MSADGHQAIARLSVLDEPTRWAAFRAIRDAAGPLTRAEVAAELGISVRLASFHLEKLVAGGFVEPTYARGEGPGPVGHPAKRYRPTSLEVDVSIPSRHYDLAARILAATLQNTAESPPSQTLASTAAAYGRRLGAEATGTDEVDRLLTALRQTGFEPAASGTDLVLRNCPFKDVAAALPEVVCAMNVAFVGGVLDGAGTASRRAILSPSADRCCVVIAA